MVTTEKISIEYTQEKMRNNQNMPLQWNQQNTNTGSNSKKWGSKKLEDKRKQKQNGKSASPPVITLNTND